MQPAAQPVPIVEWDDELWERVWERSLGPVERHSVGVAVWRRRVPDEPFETIVAMELARRWRAHTMRLAAVYALWTVFWGAIAWSDWRADGRFEALLCPACALVGVAAVLACFAVRRHLRTPARVVSG